MYNKLTLYYLHQLGIRPWIQKKSISPVHVDCTLLVITSVLHAKATSLLKRMLHFLAIPSHDVRLMTIEEFNNNIPKPKPSAVLFLGGADPIQFNCPVWIGPPVDALLANPVAKKRVFLDLNDLKTWISAH